MDLTQFRLDVADGIATVTFDRPPVNAQNRRTREELIMVFDAISDRDDIRVAILTATGNMFSAGADLKERVDLVHEPGDYVRHNRLVREFFYAVTDCTKPVLMLACDIMIASDNAYFSMPEINVGLAGGARFLMEHVGRSRTRAMYLTGRRVPAAELYRLGVIEACPPRDELMAAALEIAREIAAKSPLAIRHIKRALNTIEELPVRDAYRFEQSVTVELSHTEDAREAQRAFVEKRKPVFKGK
jgi:enoyl-CoA hydratase